MIKAIRIFPSAFLLACLGCAGPSLATRVVHSEPSWFVRLDTYADPIKAAALHYDHPAEWTEAELNAILGRLHLQELVGLLEQKPAPRAVFSSEEISQLAPMLKQAFHMARPSEWIVFYLARSTGAAQGITSGGFFLEGRQFHVIVANHRELASPGPEGADAAQANPVRSLRGAGGTLTFDPPMFVISTQSNWMGGYSGAPASELVLDHTAFLASARLTSPVPLAPAPIPAAQISPAPASTPPQAPVSETGNAGLKNEVLRLQEEVTRLKQQVEEQADEIARLKARAAELERLQRKQPSKKPAR